VCLHPFDPCEEYISWHLRDGIVAPLSLPED